jgi:transposase
VHSFAHGIGQGFHQRVAGAVSGRSDAYLIVATQPRGKQIHVICDNVSSHKTDRVADFLAQQRRVQIHFTPTYSSWLNQVENWFSKIQRDIIARGIFTSVADLDKKLMRYIRSHNEDPKPMKWKYADASNRILPVPFH